MIAMDQIKHIKSLYFEQGMNLSEISSETKLDWKTVKKYVDKEDFNEPPPVLKASKKRTSKLDPFKPQIDAWLEQDRSAPRKQRHTAQRIFDRLKDECGYDGCRTLVIVYVAEKKEEMKTVSEGYIPLIHLPGEAQADFGSATFYENGIEVEGKYFVLSFPQSNAGYIQLKYGENLECMLESLVSIFEHIGGVPTEIWFDNASAIVNKVIRDGGRNISDRFTRFQLHYGFKAVFMNPASGWEKGNVLYA